MVLIRRSVIIRKVCFWDCRCGYAALLSVSCDRRDARVCGAEIDFVIQRDGQLIPIEVKRGVCGTILSVTARIVPHIDVN